MTYNTLVKRIFFWLIKNLLFTLHDNWKQTWKLFMYSNYPLIYLKNIYKKSHVCKRFDVFLDDILPFSPRQGQITCGSWSRCPAGWMTRCCPRDTRGASCMWSTWPSLKRWVHRDRATQIQCKKCFMLSMNISYAPENFFLPTYSFRAKLPKIAYCSSTKQF